MIGGIKKTAANVLVQDHQCCRHEQVSGENFIAAPHPSHDSEQGEDSLSPQKCHNSMTGATEVGTSLRNWLTLYKRRGAVSVSFTILSSHLHQSLGKMEKLYFAWKLQKCFADLYFLVCCFWCLIERQISPQKCFCGLDSLCEGAFQLFHFPTKCTQIKKKAKCQWQITSQTHNQTYFFTRICRISLQPPTAVGDWHDIKAIYK